MGSDCFEKDGEWSFLKKAGPQVQFLMFSQVNR